MPSNSSSSFNVEGSIFRLKNSEIFDGLAEPKVYQREQIIYQQGDEPEYVYYLKSGRVQIYVASPGGAERILAVFTAGNLFGKSSFFDKMPRASCAKALQKSEIVRVDKSMMMGLIARYPQFAFDMLEYLSGTIRVFSGQIENMSFLTADRRVARFLVENLPAAPGAGIACTHDEISGVIGASRVTVSKILNRFAQNGWIETGYREIRVRDAEALTAFGG